MGSLLLRRGGRGEDYICLTDIARYKDQDGTDDHIRNWLRNRTTLEFLGIWEQLNNPGLNPVEFDGIKKLAGLNTLTKSLLHHAFTGQLTASHTALEPAAS